MRFVASLVAFTLMSSMSLVASADECEGWFCDDDKASSDDASPAPTPKAGDDSAATVPGAEGVGSDVLTGKIIEVVPGDHLTLQLPNGETKTLKWSELLQLQIKGKIVIGAGGAATPAPPPAAAPPAASPPVVVITPPPPTYAPKHHHKKHLKSYGGTYAPPPPPYLPPAANDSSEADAADRKAFRERWTLGLGLSFLSPNDRATFFKNGPNMTEYVGGGNAFEASLGYRISPAWTPYGFYEYGRYRTGSANTSADSPVTSSLVGLGMRANTNPEGPLGFFVDFGVGYRWLTVPYAGGASDGRSVMSGTGKTEYSGWEYLRLGLGLAIASSQNVRWTLAFTGSAGSFSKANDSNSGCVGPSEGGCNEIPEERRGSYAFGGFAIGGHFDL